MDSTTFTQSPFAVLTFIAAPALLTNASSVLAMSTINRMLRTRDRMHELFASAKAGEVSREETPKFLMQVERVERQGVVLLLALKSIYVGLASFAGATLVTLLGASLSQFAGALWYHIFGVVGLLLGFTGVGGLVVGCLNLFHATQLSLMNMREDAASIREQLTLPTTPP